MPEDFLTLSYRAGSEVVPAGSILGISDVGGDGSRVIPSSSEFKPRASEAKDMVVLLLSETIWIANDAKSHI